MATTRGFTVAVWVGDFSGRPMEAVSGITGAGPLLHRAVMATARRTSPGVLTTPVEAGAVAVPVCRLSGLRATSECAQLTEWFAPGSEPTRVDDWERGGRVTLPAQYAEWAEQSRRGVTVALADPEDAAGAAGAVRAPIAAAAAVERRDDATTARFRIISPLDGDRYAVPSGVEPQFATVALRAVGPGAEQVQWFVDGEPHSSERWTPTSGEHVIRAVSARGEAVEVRVVVEE